MNILLVNDDGSKSMGFRLINEILSRMGHNIFSFVPNKDCSGYGCKINLNTTIAVISCENNCYIVLGSPIDCVLAGLAVTEEMGFPIDCVVSGINEGLNFGLAKRYSGTVCAAQEGLIAQKPSIAISFSKEALVEFDLNEHIPLFSKIFNHYLLESRFSNNYMLNINAISFIPVPVLHSESDIREEEIPLFSAYRHNNGWRISLNKSLKDCRGCSGIMFGFFERSSLSECNDAENIFVQGLLMKEDKNEN